MRRWRTWAGIAAALVAVGILIVLVRSGGVQGVRQFVEMSGVWAPLLFVLLQGVVTITPVPRTVFTVAAGVLFGTLTGVALALAGTVLASVGAYWLVRLVGSGFVQRHAHRPGVAWVQRRLDHSGLLAMLSLRLIPAVPFAVLNYAAGLAGVRMFPYVVGTVLGVLPGTVAIVVLGDAVTGGGLHPLMFAVSLAGGLLGLAGAAWAARRTPGADRATPPELSA